MTMTIFNKVYNNVGKMKDLEYINQKEVITMMVLSVWLNLVA